MFTQSHSEQERVFFPKLLQPDYSLIQNFIFLNLCSQFKTSPRTWCVCSYLSYRTSCQRSCTVVTKTNSDCLPGYVTEVILHLILVLIVFARSYNASRFIQSWELESQWIV